MQRRPIFLAICTLCFLSAFPVMADQHEAVSASESGLIVQTSLGEIKGSFSDSGTIRAHV